MEKIQLSFKFSEFSLDVEHKYINDIGKFAIFCLRTFADGFSIHDLSKITNIAADVIKKQLLFLQEQKYISEEYTILENAVPILELSDFLNSLADENLIFHVEHYIWNKDNKELFYLDRNLHEISNTATHTEVIPILGLIKISSLLEEMKSSNSFVDFLIEKFPEQSSLINDYAGDFIFKINHNGYNHLYKDLPVKQLTELDYQTDSTIKLAIPFTEYRAFLKEANNPEWEEYNSWYNANKSILNCSICRLSGHPIDNETIFESYDPKVTLLPKIAIEDALSDTEIKIPLKLVLKNILEIKEQESYYLRSLNDQNINSYIKF